MTMRGIPRTVLAAIESRLASGEYVEHGKPRRPPPPDIAGKPVRVCVTVPVKTVNPTNGRQDWWRVSKRIKAEHAAVLQSLQNVPESTRTALAKGCVVTMTRLSAGHLDPVDGLPPTLKGIKDAVAAWLLGGKPGERDEDDRVTWKLGQLKCERGTFAVMVTMETRP